MKISLFLLSIAAMIFVSSCTMDKRIYSSGWHTEWANNRSHELEKSSSKNQELITEPKIGKSVFIQEILTAGRDTGNKPHFVIKPEIKNSSYHKNFPNPLRTHEINTDTGSVIITKNGVVINCKIVRETSMRIYYIKNETHDSILNKSEQSILRTDVTYYGLKSKVRNPEQIKEDKLAEKTIQKNKKVNGWAVASFCFSLLATTPIWWSFLALSGLVPYIFGLLFLLPIGACAGVISGIVAHTQIKNNKMWKGKGWATAGILLGVLDFILIILILNALSSMNFSISI